MSAMEKPCCQVLNIARAVLDKMEIHKKVLGRRMNQKLWIKHYFISGRWEYEEYSNEGHFHCVRNKRYEVK